MNGELRKAFEYFVSHQQDLVSKYSGKVIVIHDEEVVGAYEDEAEATTAARKKFELGHFLVQRVQPGTDSFTQTYYSRVAVH